MHDILAVRSVQLADPQLARLVEWYQPGTIYELTEAFWIERRTVSGVRLKRQGAQFSADEAHRQTSRFGLTPRD